MIRPQVPGESLCPAGARKGQMAKMWIGSTGMGGVGGWEGCCCWKNESRTGTWGGGDEEKERNWILEISPCFGCRWCCGPGPGYASVEIASMLSFRKCSGMWRNERER